MFVSIRYTEFHLSLLSVIFRNAIGNDPDRWVQQRPFREYRRGGGLPLKPTERERKGRVRYKESLRRTPSGDPNLGFWQDRHRALAGGGKNPSSSSRGFASKDKQRVRQGGPCATDSEAGRKKLGIYFLVQLASVCVFFKKKGLVDYLFWKASCIIHKVTLHCHDLSNRAPHSLSNRWLSSQG